MPFILFFLFFLILFIYNIGIVSFILYCLSFAVPMIVCFIVSEGEDLRTKKGWKGLGAGLLVGLIILTIYGLSLFDWSWTDMWHEVEWSLFSVRRKEF